MQRLKPLVDAGVRMQSPEEMWRVGLAVVTAHIEICGYTGRGAANRDDPEKVDMGFHGAGTSTNT